MAATLHHPFANTPVPLVALSPDEAIAFDSDVLTEFCAKNGDESEDMIADILFRIEERLVLAEWQVIEDEQAGLRRSAEELVSLAGQIGMLTLERAATAVVDCLHTRNYMALPGCAARLARLASHGKLSDWALEGGGTVA